MLTHTYHGRDVWEVRDRIGSLISHMLNGPTASVIAVAERMAITWPTLRVVRSVEQAQVLEIVLHRTATDSGGTGIADTNLARG